ncbi:hypothetical protein MAR_015902 [Mya arenaria]|uniref:Uncharacterized protein n=1 Tax=Mya arenaria TaxID=6604 RepID=A0ABY7FIC9_MYAAR|nr:hypothetical protein MAR_015902 [Mya arenaria]
MKTNIMLMIHARLKNNNIVHGLCHIVNYHAVKIKHRIKAVSMATNFLTFFAIKLSDKKLHVPNL